MKITFLSFYNGQVHRGVETFVHELANQLSLKHEVSVCQCGPRLPGAKYKTATIEVNADWSRINELRHLSTMLFLDFKFPSLLRRFYLDYWSRKQRQFALKSFSVLPKDTKIIVSAGSGWVSLLARLWCWKNGIKLITSAQSGPGWDDRINLFCRPDAFVALTGYQAQWARQNGFGVKVVKIPNGVNLSEFNPNVKPVKVNLPRPIILSVAALEPGKRLDLTLRAVAELPHASLLIIGTGGLKEQLETTAVKLLPDRFEIIDVPHVKIPAYYAAADLVTMVPPLTESFGIVFLEAMAANKPVVTTDDPPRREIVGDAGIFVDPENTAEYTQALEKALEKDWADLPRRQAEKFSWDKIAKQYEELFNSL